MTDKFSDYKYENAELNDSHGYLLPALKSILEKQITKGRIFELGCGNGAISNELTSMGFSVVGVDPSEQGISQANQRYPALELKLGSAYDNLAEIHGHFPIVVSLEVVEHVYFPRKYASTVFNLLEPGGTAIISTPYHGYIKNLALAITGKLDDHFTALWDGGHIKFWSEKTISILLDEIGFKNIHFRRAGRGGGVIAKSMIAIAKKPES